MNSSNMCSLMSRQQYVILELLVLTHAEPGNICVRSGHSEADHSIIQIQFRLYFKYLLFQRLHFKKAGRIYFLWDVVEDCKDLVCAAEVAMFHRGGISG